MGDNFCVQEYKQIYVTQVNKNTTDTSTHKQQLQKILQFHGIKNKTELLKILSQMLRTNPIGSIIENDGLQVDNF